MKGAVPGSCFVEYRPIPGFASIYRMGSDRTVWTCDPRRGNDAPGLWRPRKLARRAGCAPWLTLVTAEGRKVSRTIAVLMRLVFPPVDADEEEGAGPDPRASFGEDNGRAKITKAQAEELRRLKRGGWTTGDLMKRYGISKSNVYAVFNGLTWADTPPDLPDPGPMMDVAPAPAAPERHRRVRNPIHVHRSLRRKPADSVPLEALEMPRREVRPVERRPLDVAEVRRLHADGWSVRDLVARYGVRPHVIGAVLQVGTPTAGCAPQ